MTSDVMTKKPAAETVATGAAGTEALCPIHLRTVLRSQSKTISERSQLAFAESITACALGAYWSSLGSGLELPAAPSTWRAPSNSTRFAAEQFGRAIAKLTVSEAASHLGLLYTTLLPKDWRSSRGVYYTPPTLADRLLDQADAAGVDWSTARVLDPAAGAGAFLIPIARRMLRALGPCTPAVAMQNLSARLRGYELDPFAAWLAQVFIEAEALPLIVAAGRRPTQFVTVCDSLDIDGYEAFDLVVGNPPFGRLRLGAERRKKFARSLFGHANLYTLFMDQAVRLTRKNGVVSFLTPSSFLAGEYFKNIRAVLWNEAPPVSLDFMQARKGVFEDVLQETVLATYRKGSQRTRACVSFMQLKSGEPAKVQAAGDFTLPKEATGPWFLPRHSDDAALARKLRTMPTRLVDWGYTVSTGPLVWNRHKPQLLDEPEPGAVPLVWAESVTRDGRFVFRHQKRNHKPFLRVRAGDDWLVVRRGCVVLQRTTAKEQVRRLIAAEMPAGLLKRYGGVSVENHLNMMIPCVSRPEVSPAILAAFLNSEAADRAFRCLSGSVAVSAYELENLPLPLATDLKKLIGRRVTAKGVSEAAAFLYARRER